MERSFVTVPAVQASLAWATALHAGAQAFEVAALSAKYGAQTLAAAAELWSTSTHVTRRHRQDRLSHSGTS